MTNTVVTNASQFLEMCYRHPNRRQPLSHVQQMNLCQAIIMAAGSFTEIRNNPALGSERSQQWLLRFSAEEGSNADQPGN